VHFEAVRSKSSKVVDFWYESKALVRLPISPSL